MQADEAAYRRAAPCCWQPALLQLLGLLIDTCPQCGLLSLHLQHSTIQFERNFSVCHGIQYSIHEAAFFQTLM